MPPTAPMAVPAGRIVRIAAIPGGPSTLAGKNFSADAPLLSASSASDAVKQPGIEQSPASDAAAITSGSVLGLTIRRPPRSASCFTSSTVSTVPAPIRARPPNRLTAEAMETHGRGELSGISIASKPSSTRTVRTGSTSSGSMPRRMATRESFSGGQAGDMLISYFHDGVKPAGGSEQPGADGLFAIDHANGETGQPHDRSVKRGQPLRGHEPDRPGAVALTCGSDFGADQQAGQMRRALLGPLEAEQL